MSQPPSTRSQPRSPSPADGAAEDGHGRQTTSTDNPPPIVEAAQGISAAHNDDDTSNPSQPLARASATAESSSTAASNTFQASSAPSRQQEPLTNESTRLLLSSQQQPPMDPAMLQTLLAMPTSLLETIVELKRVMVNTTTIPSTQDGRTSTERTTIAADGRSVEEPPPRDRSPEPTHENENLGDMEERDGGSSSTDSIRDFYDSDMDVEDW
eukprot:CAMPEP_0172459720 /NCGR_PEP_ID=MMETSP1065-20121228/33823_1 /TAXON_ID=265537 /ORGANISM="Amphiprora paludosa, Strain CCMP125" /LENGTH=211 /DNA_ID=CAMNT_0013214501 /DNA_START=1648 /DNA_END=2280 /DNA_ORIENTATION=-